MSGGFLTASDPVVGQLGKWVGKRACPTDILRLAAVVVFGFSKDLDR